MRSLLRICRFTGYFGVVVRLDQEVLLALGNGTCPGQVTIAELHCIRRAVLSRVLVPRPAQTPLISPESTELHMSMLKDCWRIAGPLYI